MRRIKSDQFHFKQFSVTHKRSSMKVGTDGVLLGAWVNVTHVKSVLDIGTGSGVIALMIAQRSGASHIDAVELDMDAAEDARENFKQAPWAERLHLYHCPVQLFQTKKKYDLIVSNPPYFSNSYKPENENRMVARHTESLSFQDLLEAANKWLNPAGRLAVILPAAEGKLFKTWAQAAGMVCIREWTFQTRRNKPVERQLMEFARMHKTIEHGKILLYEHDSGETWATDYINLTRDFYLKS
ncbi:MAG: methyltransferase [Cyclobacteriaceae bacterium]|nr:methyltransferase [Cyclobacteriaceae bacterium]UYN85923.1 MAG: methyltransferase [Cyclobacteriaceae bacterium]